MGPLSPVNSSYRSFSSFAKLINNLIHWKRPQSTSCEWSRAVGPVVQTLLRQDFDSRKYCTNAQLRKKEYTGRKLLGFTMEQMYDVVQDVENYKHFVPFCRKSDVKSRKNDYLIGELEIGFNPVVESYVSHVQLDRPRLVKADCRDGKLFDHLTTTWKFNPGLRDHPQSCVIDFYVSFEFKSLIHSQMAHFFFSELVKQMESAFFAEAKRRYGPPSIEMVKLKVKV